MKKKIALIAMSMTLLIGGATVIYGESSNEAGSETNPLVTLKYVDSRIDQLKNYIDQNIEIFRQENEAGKSSETGTTVNAVFEVVEVKAGQQLICGASAEIIWRAGQATVIASELGGLTDVTDGKNLAHGEIVEKDHHIIVPRGDGRGMNVDIDSYVMVKGEYTIK